MKIKFECPFCKCTTFAYEVNEYNLESVFPKNDYPDFVQFPTIKFSGKGERCYTFQKVLLHDLREYYIPFYNETFMKNEFSYFYYVKALYGMGIVKNDYEKWVLCLLMSQIMYNDFVINENDVQYFGGEFMLEFLNKYFTHQIMISYDDNDPTEITFNESLWCYRYLKY